MRRSSQEIAARGFSLIELMVAMVIGLIGMIIIFQVFEVSEGIRRTTTAGGDAQQNGTLALYLMERDLRNAGMGFNDTPYAGCSMAGSDSAQTPNNFPAVAGSMPMVPVNIVTGAAATTPDQISIFYGGQGQIANATTLSSSMAAPTDPLKVTNRFGYRNGDLVLLLQPGPPFQNCNFMEVTFLPSTLTAPVGPTDQVSHDTGATYTDVNGVTRTARFNPAGGLGISYTGGASTSPTTSRVFNLGNLYDANAQPVYNTYSIANNTLTVVSAFSASAPAAVADNIVHMRALYGLDDGNTAAGTIVVGYSPGVAGDGIVDRFVDSATFNAIAPLPWASLIAVRVAVVARSATPETSSQGVGQPCDTTTVAPTWSGGTFNLSADPNWQCYRYRVYETTIPLRNWIWKSS
jgi:type IV pilus assembly protein PilW